MNITNFPKDKIVDKEREMHPGWRQFLNQLVNQLQTFMSDERYQLPHQDNEAVGKFDNADTDKQYNHIGGILYNTDSTMGMINSEGSYKNLSTYHGALTTAQINAIPSGKRNGRIVYDTDLGVVKIGANDTFITVS